jgi:hypothetical protein
MARSTAVVILLTASLLPLRAAAWSDAGHRIVGAIAEERIGPAARRLLREIVGERPLSDHEIATWADDVRDSRTGPWHYVNVPRAAEGYLASRDCTSRGCVVSALEQAIADLRDGDDSLRLADALRYLVHFAGDVHDPMHAGEARDRGGNDTAVRLGNRARKNPISVHHLWDFEVLEPFLDRSDPVRAAHRLAEAITPAAARAWAADLAPASWATESHRVARAVYLELEGYPVDGGTILLPANYAALHRAMTAEALSKAGVRLAAVLDSVAAARETRRSR